MWPYFKTGLLSSYMPVLCITFINGIQCLVYINNAVSDPNTRSQEYSLDEVINHLYTITSNNKSSDAVQKFTATLITTSLNNGIHNYLTCNMAASECHEKAIPQRM